MKELIQQGIVLYIIETIGYIYASFLWKTHRVRNAIVWPKIFAKDFRRITEDMYKKLEEIRLMAEAYAQTLLNNRKKV